MVLTKSMPNANPDEINQPLRPIVYLQVNDNGTVSIVPGGISDVNPNPQASHSSEAVRGFSQSPLPTQVDVFKVRPYIRSSRWTAFEA